MFGSNKFLKNDPLLEAVKGAMQDGEVRRAAESLVNEEFGVYSRNAVVREHLAAYDAALEEAYKALKEGKWEGSKEDRDEDKKLAKKHGMSLKQWEKSDADKKHDTKEKMDEEQIDEISDALKARYYKKSEKPSAVKVDGKKVGSVRFEPDGSNKVGRGEWVARHKSARSTGLEHGADSRHDAKHLMRNFDEEKKLAGKDYDRDGKVESPKDEVWGSRLRAAKKSGNLEEVKKDIAKGGVTAPKEFKQERFSNPGALKSVQEAVYSYKAAREGKDIGKRGKNFEKIAQKAGAKYGSKERGEKVAGAVLAKIRAKHMKEDSSFNSAQVSETNKLALGKTVREQVVDAAPPPAYHQPAPAKPGQMQQNLRAPTGYQGPRQVTNGVKPNVSIGNVKPSVSYGMSKSGEAASKLVKPPAPAERIGYQAASQAASKSPGVVRTLVRGAAKFAGPLALGAEILRSDPANAGEDEKARQAKFASPKTNSPELTKATSGKPTTFQKTDKVGPDTSKFTGAPKAEPAASPVKQSFKQAYQAARAAGGSKAQFKWNDKTFQAAAKKSEYVAPSKQIKVDVGTTAAPKPAAAAPAPTPAKNVPTIKAPETPAKAAPAPETPKAAPAPKASSGVPSWKDQEAAIKATPTPDTVVPKAARVGRTDAAPVTPPAPEPSAKQAEPPTQSPAPVPSFQQSATPSSDMEDATKGAKKMDAIKSLKESVVSVGGNKYRIL